MDIVAETRQARNLALRREDLARQRTKWRSRPSALEFGTTSACNLACPMCAHSSPGHVVQNAPRGKRRELYDALLPTLSILKPFTLSEPLLSDLEELLPWLELHGTELDLVSNGVLLTDERLERILPHLHRISFSIDSHIPEIYDTIRVPTRFEVMDRNVKAAIPRLLEAGVLLRVNMVLNRAALPHLEGFVDYVRDELGITYIDVFELQPYTRGGKAMDPFTDPGPEATRAALERMIVRARERDITLDLLMREPFAASIGERGERERDSVAGRFERDHRDCRGRNPGVCEQVMMYLKVQPDGEAYPCCRSPRELRLGNVYEQGVDGVWNSDAARSLRRRMFAGDYPTPCRDCVFLTYSKSTVEERPRPTPWAGVVRWETRWREWWEDLAAEVSSRHRRWRAWREELTAWAFWRASIASRKARDRTVQARKAAGRVLGLPRVFR